MTSEPVVVREAAEATVDLLEGLNALLPQLSSSAKPMTFDDLDRIVKSPATRLLVAEAGGTVAGSLTLVTFRIPTGVRAWIEDVVVDESLRGARIGEHLVRRAVELAGESGARTVDLTSRLSRTSAHRLYLRCGFSTRETAVYRWSGGEPGAEPT